jgi:NAD-dependent dihydropyrimidine dehydrogenase PreA subunit
MTRYVVLGMILVGTITMHWGHNVFGIVVPSVHSVCPGGGLENLWSWFQGEKNIQKIFAGTMTLFFLTIFMGIILGRTFCGNICPFGALFEFVGKLNSKKIKVTEALNNKLSYLKYVVLIVMVGMAWATHTLWISAFGPYYAMSHLWEGVGLLEEAPIAAIVLVAVTIGAFFIERFFCRYLCPVGAFYSLFNKFSPLKVNREKDCYQCGKCNDACPMGIDVKSMEVVNSPECIECGRCVAVCPKPGEFLRIEWFGKVMKPVNILLISLLLFFGGLLVANQLGIFTVTSPTVSSVTQSGKFLGAADLRGSMTIESAAQYTGKDLKEFYRWMEIPESVPKETTLKEITRILPDYSFEKIKETKK